MTQISKKFIQNNAVDDTKIRLSNNAFLKARNAANNADVTILKVDTSNIIQFASVPEVSADPSSANALVRKSYVDNLLNGLKWKNSVRAATTAAITLAGAQTIDGVSVIDGDRVLVKNQSSAADNGIYIVGTSFTRATDADAGSELVSAAMFVEEGTVNADKGFVCATNAPITVGTTDLSFVQFTSAGAYVAGDGIDITGSTISVLLATDSGLEFNSAALRVKVDPSGAIARSAAGILVSVDNTTLKINGSNDLEGLKSAADVITLSGTDITNQYVDLVHTATSSASISLFVVGGPMQLSGTDYTVSLTGGTAGVTRITFAGELATAGAAALIADDILVIKYEYL